MKKFCCVFTLVFLVSLCAAAQNSSGAANKNTALRCLKLAENCLVVNDWQNALSQAKLGLSYDDSISDLYYIKAASELNLGGTKADALRTISIAFRKDSWAGYSKTGARILNADLLSDTGLYEESLNLLDQDPFLYSADAEFIRIKNYYRIGSKESLYNARTRLNSDRRVYPSDSRFPEIFFLFESMFLNEAEHNGVKYEIPEIVRNIAESYIAKLPDYTDANSDMELLAVNFAGPEEKLRLVKSIEAKNKNLNALLAIAALRSGVYTDQQAFDMFFGAIGSETSLDMLETFVSLLKDEEVTRLTAETLADFNGTIYIDEDMDLQYEFTVQYEKGRPQYIKYDSNNDGETELYSSCDFGSPVFIYFNSKKVQFFYDGFPKVSKIIYSDRDLVFNFLHDDMQFSPVDFVTDNVFARTGVDFYIPTIAHDFTLPLPQEIISRASSFELPVTERDEARIVYTVSGGNLVFAEFYEQNNRYAYCDFSDEDDIVRFVDYDNNGSFETIEQYSKIPENMDSLRTFENAELINNVFNFIDGKADLYLHKIRIDSNANTICEYSEEYLELNGKIIIWDNDDNGLPDCQYIRYPQHAGEPVVEDTIYYDTNGLQMLALTVYDGVPVKMNADGSEVIVYAGETENLYWIEVQGTSDMEDTVMKNVTPGVVQGKIEIIEYSDQRISVIKVGANYYCRLLQPSIAGQTEESR